MEKIIGKTWTHRAVLIAAIGIYLGTLIVNPAVAKSSAETGLQEMRKLIIPIVTAMFLGCIVKNLVTPKFVSKFFGTSERKEVLTAGVVGSILPPCPYTAYPVIKGFKDGGMRFSALMMMLITATVVEVPQFFAGIAILGTKIEAIRISFAFLASIIVGYLFFLLYTHLPIKKSMVKNEALVSGRRSTR